MSPALIQALIPIIAPMLIALLKKLAPSLPKPVLPVAAPLLGIVAAVVSQQAGVDVPMLDGAVLGAAGIGVREMVDQTRKI